jgi:hypothetical protein
MAKTKHETKKVEKEVVKPVEKKSKKPVYQFEIAVNDGVTKLEGDDVLEVLKSYTLPPFVQTFTVITAKKGDVLSTNTLTVFKARKIFSNSTMMTLFAKTITSKLG